MARLEGKVAVITGAGSGMGAEQARLFAREGARVVATDINDETVASIAEEIKSSDGQAISAKHDISSPEDWAEVIEATKSAFGRVDVLVNTAGVPGDVFTDAEDVDLGEWERTLSINLKGAFLGARHAIPEMKVAGGGSIINISSIGGLLGGQAGTAYSAAKSGLRGLAKNLAATYGPVGIRVNTIFPGQILTPMSQVHLSNKEIADYYIEKVPMRFFGEPSDIAYGALYLASDESRFVTGAELVIDGGVVSV